jgi:diguanylate cyclase (GGDEF)-like protein
VFSFLMVVAVLNLALGYAAAAALAESPPWSRWRWLALRWIASGPAADSASGRAAEDVAQSAPSETPTPPAITTIAGVEELPGQWLSQLAPAGVVPQSFLEGAAQLLRLEVGHYREQLVRVETRCRSLLAATDGPSLKLLTEDLLAINQRWHEKQAAAAGLLAQRSGRLGEHESLAQVLEQTLLDQAAQIRAANDLLRPLSFSVDVENGGKQVLEQLQTTVAAAHALRDQMLDLVATLFRGGPRLNDLRDNVRIDKETRLPGRLGLEAILAAWWQGDPTRVRPLCLVRIDFDRFARVNQRLGTRAGDRALVAAAALIGELIHADRQGDCLCRVAGQELLVVMGDASPHQALAAAERLRQSFEATTFDDQGATFELTLSCGVVDAVRWDSPADLLGRTLAAVQFAKKAGRNRCALDEGLQGPKTLDPPQFPVKGRVVSLGEC